MGFPDSGTDISDRRFARRNLGGMQTSMKGTVHLAGWASQKEREADKTPSKGKSTE